MMAARQLDPQATRDSQSSQLLAELCFLARHVDDLEVDTPEAEEQRIRATADELLLALRRAVQLLQQLEEVNAPPASDDALAEFDGEPTTLNGLPIVVASEPGLADVCFAGALELKQTAHELARSRTAEDLQVAVETGLRKLRRAIRASVAAAQLNGIELTEGKQLRTRDSFDLEASLVVRRLYAQFRRALRPVENDTQFAVLTALRYAAGALATLMSSPDYERARVSDRRLLRRLQQRVLLWARSAREVERGLELLHDVWTSADLLRGINRRQELRVHDAALVAELSALPGADLSAWLSRFAGLEGFDDELDALVERAQVELERSRVASILARLAELV